MKKLFIALALLPLCAFAANIYMAGDSTMAAYQKKSFPLCGWGVAMDGLCKEGVKVRNYAQPGRSIKSFMSERRWEKIMREAKKGDFVIIQFGHNDYKEGDKNFYRRTFADTTFRYFLHIYIAEARARGVTPVLCTTTVFCIYDKDGAFKGVKNQKYNDAIREVAKETGCALVDITAAAVEKYSAMSMEEASKYHMIFKPGEYKNRPKGANDNVHLRQSGAELYATMFVELARKQNLPIAKLFK